MLRGVLAGVAVCLLSVPTMAADAEPPKVGGEAKDFSLTTVGGETLKLSEQTADGKVVLLVMRGFPGYQCPLCRRQASAFAKQADAFKKADATVIMVYPGDVSDLNAKALEFLGDKKLPDGFHMVLDPGYEFTNSYGLRWDAPRETAYPSTFVIGEGRKVLFAKVSKSHGGRTNPDEVLKALN